MSRLENPKLTVEITPDPELGGFTAHVPDIPAYGEGDTVEEAIADLKEALTCHIEAVGLDATRAMIAPGSQDHQVDWSLDELVHA